MKASAAIASLSALAHPGRLAIFKLLIKAGAKGLAAGEIARATKTLPNTLSTNLSILSHAGLVVSRRDGRWIIYEADFASMRRLLSYLLEDCCGGRREICEPLMKVVESACCD